MLNRYALAIACLACSTAQAETFQDSLGNTWDLSGFMKVEASHAFSAPRITRIPVEKGGYTKPGYTNDWRTAFSAPPDSPQLGSRSSSLALQQISAGVSHETDGAVMLEARTSYRWRSTAQASKWFKTPDIAYRDGSGLQGVDFFEKFVGIGRPDLGTLRYGTQLSRSWSRSDSFSYPIGLSGQWADSGAGFGLLPEAIRLTSRAFEDGQGKLTVEVSVGRNELNDRNSVQPHNPPPSEPKVVELFMQYSRDKHLIEFTLQSSSGARQTSFGKSALLGWIGDPDIIGGRPRQAGKPSQSVAMLQGNHWPNPQNMLTYGLRHNQWSGSAGNCYFGPIYPENEPPRNDCRFDIDPGFNYGNASLDFAGFRATSTDAMLGWSHYRGLFTYTAALMYFGRGSSENPIEWGQSNSALSANLGIYRKLPEVHKGASVYVGVGFSRASRLGPAPLSAPDNQFLGFNSLYDRSGGSVTIGTNWVF
jgi:hypothetical protein